MTRIEELALVSRVVLTNDRRAFSRLVGAYQERVRRFFLMQTGGDEMLADDLAQDTFVRAWQSAGSFRMRSRLGTWLYQIAYRVWLDHRRTMERERLCVPFNEEASRLSATTADDEVRDERIDRLCRALSRMAEPARTCITLFYLEENSVRDIAHITGMEEANIRQILSRGRKKLKETYEKTTD